MVLFIQMHTTPVVSLLIELCMYPHQYLPKEAGYIMIVIFMAIYYSIIHMAHKYTGVWVYGLFDAISASQVRLLSIQTATSKLFLCVNSTPACGTFDFQKICVLAYKFF